LCPRGILLGLVDPHGGGERGWLGWLADEAFGVLGVGGVEDETTLLADGFGSAVVDV
jgi:hypothetical protein